MSNLIDIQGQIQKLQKQANDIRSREFDKTVQDIVATMLAFGITTKDLQAASSRAAKSKGTKPGRKARPKSSKSSAGTTVAAKYRGPNGESWSGRGLTPRWLAALEAQGSRKEDFAIKA